MGGKREGRSAHGSESNGRMLEPMGGCLWRSAWQRLCSEDGVWRRGCRKRCSMRARSA
jgi:hypothetical protein